MESASRVRQEGAHRNQWLSLEYQRNDHSWKKWKIYFGLLSIVFFVKKGVNALHYSDKA